METLDYFAQQIVYARQALKKHESKPIFDLHKKHNVGYWNGVIVQTYNIADRLHGYSAREVDKAVERMASESR